MVMKEWVGIVMEKELKNGAIASVSLVAEILLRKRNKELISQVLGRGGSIVMKDKTWSIGCRLPLQPHKHAC
jgi:hypothetical protein